MAVSTNVSDGIAVVTIDNPPVNATSHKVRQGLWDALEQTSRDDRVRAVVLHCAGRTFIAGADIKEFDQPPREPSLPDLLHKIETASKPWIAAIHGTALGGGLETALACHYRVAATKAKLGLPEVALGLIPGAGGTVRLPRLIAPDKALEIIAGGKPISAQMAADLGLADQLTESDLLGDAIAFAQDAATMPPPVPGLSAPGFGCHHVRCFRCRRSENPVQGTRPTRPKRRDRGCPSCNGARRRRRLCRRTGRFP